jgi:RNA polymerase sigma factor (sigma-70 family)
MSIMVWPDSERGKELVRRIQAGDPASEDDFVRIFHPRIMALASYHLRDIDTSLEITQETLLNVLQALRKSRLRDEEKLSAFVGATARNLLKNLYQKSAQAPPMVSLGLEEASALTPDQVPCLSVEKELEKRSIVGAALRTLRPMDRRILFLTLSEGLNPQEIAVMLGVKPEIVRNRKSRALKAIRKKVKKMI